MCMCHEGQESRTKIPCQCNAIEGQDSQNPKGEALAPDGSLLPKTFIASWAKKRLSMMSLPLHKILVWFGRMMEGRKL